MSDLSRLRARWVRLEKRIDALDAQTYEAREDKDEALVLVLLGKSQEAEAKLALTKTQVTAEELRLSHPDAKLRFTGV